MTPIKTIYPERPRFWRKGMERSPDPFKKSEVESLISKIERSTLQLTKIDTYVSNREQTIAKLYWLNMCRLFWGLRRDILKEKLYRQQKWCLCRFQRVSSGQYDDHYICPKCNCSIEL